MNATLAALEKARYTPHTKSRVFIESLKAQWCSIPKVEQAQMLASLDWSNGVTRAHLKKYGSGRKSHPDLDQDITGETLLDIWEEARQWMKDNMDMEALQMHARKSWEW
ncbi:hypothetical protein [Corynebacterium ulceribovis]|uniref:hypothetical protein n=1 Tax=Corynebacterium ulceribovis TaxID=487732 RepID=UPI0003806ABA|nr:hypothetical protein [Corynebacterium ulceribovis]